MTWLSISDWLVVLVVESSELEAVVPVLEVVLSELVAPLVVVSLAAAEGGGPGGGPGGGLPALSVFAVVASVELEAVVVPVLELVLSELLVSLVVAASLAAAEGGGPGGGPAGGPPAAWVPVSELVWVPDCVPVCVSSLSNDCSSVDRSADVLVLSEVEDVPEAVDAVLLPVSVLDAVDVPVVPAVSDCRLVSSDWTSARSFDVAAS